MYVNYLILYSFIFYKPEESVRSACGLTLAAISQYNPDVLKRHAALALPLAFFAMHEKGNYYTICCSSLLQCRSSIIDMHWLCMYIMESDEIIWNRIFLLVMALTICCTVCFGFSKSWIHFDCIKIQNLFFLLKFEMAFLPYTLHTKNIYHEYE